MSQQDRIQRHLDRQDIVDLSFRYSRACDRLDSALLTSVYWPDGSDDHGIFKGSAPAYIEWVINLLSQWTSSHHTNSNFLIDIDGDRATGECHWIGFYRYEVDGKPVDQLSAGRYLDRYERRAGEWRILHRTCVSEWTRSAPAASDWRSDPARNTNVGRRDRSDLVYALDHLVV